MPDEQDSNDPLITGQGDDGESGLSEGVDEALYALEKERMSFLRLTKGIKKASTLAELVPLVDQLRTKLANDLFPALTDVLVALGEDSTETDDIALQAIRDGERNRQLIEHLRGVLEGVTGKPVQWPPALEGGIGGAAPIDFSEMLTAFADLALMISAKLPDDPEVASVMLRLERAITGAAAVQAPDDAPSEDQDEDVT